jgi:hypothetical protein
MPLANTPSPTIVRDPITVPGLIVLFAPTTAQSPKTTPNFDELRELVRDARPTSTAPSAAPGPTTLPHPITLFLMNAPAQILALFMTMLWMIKQLWPITHFDPIKEPDSISA